MIPDKINDIKYSDSLNVNDVKLEDNPLEIGQIEGISDKYLAQWMYCERYFNENTQTYSKFSDYSEINEKFRPKSKLTSFKISPYKLNNKTSKVVLGNPLEGLTAKYINKEGSMFCVHPAIIGEKWVQNMEELAKQSTGKEITVMPTSSTRTVFVLNENEIPHCLKLHCPLKISRYIRNVGPKTIEHCVTVSKDLEKVDLDCFAIMRETIGVKNKMNEKDESWGYLVREVTPFPFIQEKRLLIPCFSLYGMDKNDPTSSPLIVRLITHSKLESPEDYVFNHVFKPVISCFLETFKQRGILLEAHGQNTLLELNEKLEPCRIVHRDFDETIDAKKRKELNLSMEGFHPYQIVPLEPTEDEPFGANHSIIYDKSVGKLFFDFLANAMNDHYKENFSIENLQKRCKKHFKKILPNFSDYFPKTIFKYSDTPKQGETNYYTLIDTGESPSWRPLD